MQKTYLKDYEKPEFSVLNINLDFGIFDDFVLVNQKSHYVTDNLKPIFLNGIDQELKSIIFCDKNNSTLATQFIYEKTEEGLLIHPTQNDFILNITTKTNPYSNKSLEGLYASKAFLVTQCEAQGFRKITYFPDRPDIMTLYTVSIEADIKRFPVLLSNGNRLHKKITSETRHQVTWADPWKKPSYLFALFAGDVDCLDDHFKTITGRMVNLEIYSEKGKSPRCHHALQSLKRAMKWDEDTFGREYDLSEYMIVAIDDFNAGAMENKGLNIFNSKLILADSLTATDTDFFDIESVVAHEYFHNWTGNRITLRDWFQLSLKEGLTVFRDQEFSADMTEKGIQRIRDVAALKNRQFPEDAGPNAHPVRPESCYSVDNFFTPTIYEKGAEVIRMMQNILGKKKFKLAMDRYFKKYDGQAITTDDYRETILDESGYNSDQFVNWYQTPGTPKVKATDFWNPNTKSYNLKLEQVEPFFEIPIFIELFELNGRKLNGSTKHVQTNSDDQKSIILKSQTTELTWNELSSRPIVSLLRNFSAPVTVLWNRPQEDYFFLALNDDDTFNRNESLQMYWLNCFKILYNRMIAEKLPPFALGLESLVNLLDAILRNEVLEIEIKAKLFSFPSASVIIQFMGFLDASGFLKTEQTIKNFIGRSLSGSLKNIVLKLNKELIDLEAKSNLYDQNVAAMRELKMNLTDLLSSCETDTFTYETKNFTSILFQFSAKLNVLVLQPRKNEILDFYSKWKSEPLVINKWLQTIATSEHPETFETIKWICSNGYFNSENPNQVFALLRSFGNNLFYFHQNNQHYDFFLGQITAIDAFNPQVAARLASCLQIIGLLADEKKKYLTGSISNLISTNKLSKNSYEVFSNLV